MTRRTNAQGASEVWSVDLHGTKRILLRSISLSEPAAIIYRLTATMSRDQKKYAHVYARHISAEYILQNLH